MPEVVDVPKILSESNKDISNQLKNITVDVNTPIINNNDNNSNGNPINTNKDITNALKNQPLDVSYDRYRPRTKGSVIGINFNPNNPEFEYLRDPRPDINYDNLERNNAEVQSLGTKWWRGTKQFGANALASFIGTFANTLDLSSAYKTAKGEVTGSNDDFNSSFLGLTTKDLNDWAHHVAENNRIYERDPEHANLLDAGWLANTFAGTGILLGTGAASALEALGIEYATDGLGTGTALSELGINGSKMLDTIKGLFGSAKTDEAIANSYSIIRGLRNKSALFATLGRYSEARLEAQTNYEEGMRRLNGMKKPDGSDYTQEEKEHLASEGARVDFNLTMAQLPLDLLAMKFMVFNPVSGAQTGIVEQGLEKVFGHKLIGKVGSYLTGMGIEGLEGSTIPIFQEEGHHYSDILAGHDDGSTLGQRISNTVGSKEFIDNFFIGALGGALTGGILKGTLQARSTIANRMFNKNYNYQLSNIGNYQNTLNTLLANNIDTGLRIQEADKKGDINRANQLRKQLNTQLSLFYKHNDGRKGSNLLYNSWINYLQTTKNQVDNGNLSEIENLFGKVSPETTQHIKDNFQSYIDDAKLIGDTYDNLKDRYTASILPSVTLDKFLATKETNLTPELVNELQNQKSKLTTYQRLSDNGKKLFDTQVEIETLKANNKNLQANLDGYRDEERGIKIDKLGNEYKRDNVQATIEFNNQRIAELEQQERDINNDDTYTESQRSFDDNLHNQLKYNDTNTSDYVNAFYNVTSNKSKTFLFNKNVELYNNKKYLKEYLSKNIKNAKSKEDIDNIKTEVEQNNLNENNNNRKGWFNRNKDNKTKANNKEEEPISDKNFKEEISDKEYNSFIDKGIVSKERLENIANKDVKKLNAREKNIYNKNKKQVEEIRDNIKVDNIDLDKELKNKTTEINAKEAATKIKSDNDNKTEITEEDEKNFNDLMDNVDKISEELKNKNNKSTNTPPEFTDGDGYIVINDDELDNLTSFAPIKFNYNSLSENTKNNIKNNVANIINRIGGEPSFSKILRYINNSVDLDRLSNMIDMLGFGWELNGYKKEDYNNIFNITFDNPIDNLNSIFDNIISNVKEESKVRESEKGVVGIGTQGEPVYNYNPNSTDETDSTFGFTTFKVRQIETLDDNGNKTIKYENTSELSDDGIIDHTQLLKLHEFLPGTELEMYIPKEGSDEFNNVVISLYDIYGQRTSIKWIDYLQQNPNLTQEQIISKIPILIKKKGNNKAVAYVHDIDWYNPSKAYRYTSEEKMNEAREKTRAIREEIFNSEKQIVEGKVLSKTGQNFSALRTKQKEDGTYETISINEANPNAELGIVIGGVIMTDSNNSFTKDNTKILVNIPEKLIGQDGFIYDMRPIGIAEDGRIKYVGSNTTKTKINQDVKDSIIGAIKAFLYKDDTQQKEVISNILKYNKSDISTIPGLERYLSHFIRLYYPKNSTKVGTPLIYFSNRNTLNISSYNKSINNNVIKITVSENGKITLYLSNNETKTGSINDIVNILTKTPIELGTSNKGIEKLDSMLDYFNNSFTKELRSSNNNIVFIKDNGTTVVGKKYMDYLMDTLQTNIRSINIGTNEKPEYVTNINPSITFDTNKRIAENKEKQKLSIDSQNKEVKKEEVKPTETKVEEKEVRIKSKDQEFLDDSKDMFNDMLGNVSLSPISNTDINNENKINEEISKSLYRVYGLEPSQQEDLVQFMYVSIKKLIDANGRIKAKEAKKELIKYYKENITPLRNTLINKLKELNIAKNNNEITEETFNISSKRYNILFSKIEAVRHNFNQLTELAFDRAESKGKVYTSKLEQEENNNDREDSRDNSNIGDEGENTRTYFTDVLTENPDNKLTTKIRLLVDDVLAYTKDGQQVKGFLGLPTYVNENTIIQTLRTTLADVPAHWQTMIAALEDRVEAINWMPAIIEKLSIAPKDVKSQFQTNMANNSLNMEFSMRIYNRATKSFTSKIYKTALTGILDLVKTQWNNNLLGLSNLVESSNNKLVLNMKVAKRMLAQYNSWINRNLVQVENSMDKYKNEISKIKSGSYTNIKTNGNLLKELNDKFKEDNVKLAFKLLGRDYTISKIDGENDLFKVEYASSVTASREEVAEWLSNFGITLDNKTMNVLYKDGLRNGRNITLWNNLFYIGTEADRKTNGLFGILYNKLEDAINKGGIEFNDEGNNFLNDSTIKALARLEAEYNETLTPFSFRDNGKTYYAITTPKLVMDRMLELKKGNEDTINELKSVPYSQDSLWLIAIGDNNFRDNFDIATIGNVAIKQLGKNVYKDSDITSLSKIDHELLKLDLFTYSDAPKFGYVSGDSTFTTFPGTNIQLRYGKILNPTYSDKPQVTSLTTILLDLEAKDLKEGNFSNDLLSVLYNQLIRPEIKRMFQSATDEITDNRQSNIEGYRKGKNIFFNIPIFNKLSIPNNDITLGEFIRNSIETTSLESIEKNEELMKFIYDNLENHIKDLINDKIDDWTKLGLISVDGNNKIKSYKYISYETVDKNNKYSSESTDEKIRQMAADYVINNLVANANYNMMLSGDMAYYFKSDSEDPIQMVKDTFDNYGKRMAAMIAPGNRLADSYDEKYLQLFIKDRDFESKSLDYLKTILPESEWNKFTNVDASDAQEYHTWQEHLYILEKLGRVDGNTEVTQKEIDDARRIFNKKDLTIDKLTDEEKALIKKIGQPIKPVYSGLDYDNESNLLRMIYIKSSSFPLIPQLTTRFEIDKLRKSMEDLQTKRNMYIRASYQTANKVGSVTVNKSEVLFDENGNITKGGLDSLEKNSIILNRKNFRIQQEVPYKAAKGTTSVTLGSQILKMLFSNNLMNYNGFTYNGRKDVTGSQLFSEYNNALDRLLQEKRNQLFDELGMDKNGVPVDIKETYKRLQNILVNEAKERNYNLKDISGLEINLETGKFKVPLWANSSKNKYEALLNAIVSNRMLRIKMPGFSAVVGSSRGFRTDETLSNEEKLGIICTSSFDRSKGLQYTRKEDGTLKYAQVFAPNRFFDSKGNLIDFFSKKNGDWVYLEETENGYKLKDGMIEDELMKLFSFRTPTSGHVSGSILEIVGFLPEKSGDLLIVPAELTKQKGLDFDIDKESVYNQHHFVDKETGKISVLKEEYRNKILEEADKLLQDTKDNSAEGNLVGDIVNKIFGSNYVYNEEDFKADNGLKKLNSIINERLAQNEIIGITKSVFSNPNDEIQAKIHKALDTKYLEDEAKFIDEINNNNKKTFNGLSDTYQRDKLISAADGKNGTSSYALANSFNAQFEQLNNLGKGLFMFYTIKGEMVRKKWNFGGTIYDSALGEYKSNDGTIIAENLGELLQMAVDNEKLQIMSKLGINDETLSVQRLMAMLGINKGKDGHSISSLFLNQPIIREYSEKMKNSKSLFFDYNSNAEQDVIDELMNKYSSEKIKTDIDDEERDNINGDEMTNEKFINEIKNNGQDKDFQVAVLERFLDLKSYAKKVNTLMSNANFSQNQLGKSFFDVIDKKEALDSLPYIGGLFNSHQVIGDYIYKPDTEEEYNKLIEEGYYDLGNNMVKPNTVSGKMLVNSVTTAYNLWNEHFPYDKPQLKKLFDTIINESLGNNFDRDTKRKKIVEIKQNILNEYTKYISAYSNNRIYSNKEDINNIRKSLYIDTDSNISLPMYLLHITNNIEGNPIINKYIKSNPLLRRFEYKKGEDGGNSKIILSNSSGESLNENALNEAISRMIVERNPDGSKIELPKVKNKQYTLDTLAKALIEYTYSGNAVQEAVQFTKYIPNAYLEAVGYNSFIRSIDNMLNNTSPNPTGESWNIVHNFVMQYFQHNPDEVSTKLNKKNLLQEINNNNSTKIDDLTEFNLKNESNKAIFVVIRNPNEKQSYKTNSGFNLYWFRGDKYVRIPVLGSFAMDEYQPNNFIGKSILNDSKISNNLVPVDIVNNEVKNNPQISNEQEVSTNRFNIDNGNIQDVLTSMAASDIGYQADLAKTLLQFANKDIKIEFKDSIPVYGENFEALYGHDTNTITINPNRLNNYNNTKLAELLNEEILHSLTVDELNKYITISNNGTTNVNLNAPKYISNIVQLYNEAKRIFNEKNPGLYKEMIEKFSKREALNSLELTAYGFKDIYEFVARTFSDKNGLQAYLQKEQFKKSNDTMLERFLQHIIDLLNGLGLNIDKSSTAYKAMANIFNLLEDESKQRNDNLPSQMTEEEQMMWNMDISNELDNPPDYGEDYNENSNSDINLSPIQSNYPDKTFNFVEEKCL